MNHSEIVKEADRKRKEHEKLNHIKVYECQDTLSWYICNFGGNGESAEYPFGFFFADYFNQLLSLRSKETFITYEKRMRSGAKNEKDINPIFDKSYHYYLWAFNEQTKDEFTITPHATDEELANIYNHVCWLWEYIKNDVETLHSDLRLLKENTTSNNKNNNIYEIYYVIYRYVQKMVLSIWYRQINSSYYDKNSEDYNSNDEYLRFTDEDIAECEANNKEIITPDFAMNCFVGGFRYIGYENVKFTDNTESFCRGYDVSNLLFLVAEDMLRFMLHQTTHNFNFCPECRCMFVTTHGNQKHCPACNLIIRQKKRKQNKARYLHKRITDYINNYRSGEYENASELFRNESNYYWNIVQGKKPEKIKEYSAKIKTEADYIKWLEKKYEEIKAQK